MMIVEAGYHAMQYETIFSNALLFDLISDLIFMGAISAVEPCDIQS